MQIQFPPTCDFLTQWVSLAILVGYGEYSNNGMALASQLLINLLTKLALTDHGNLHLQARGWSTLEGGGIKRVQCQTNKWI